MGRHSNSLWGLLTEWSALSGNQGPTAEGQPAISSLQAWCLTLSFQPMPPSTWGCQEMPASHFSLHCQSTPPLFSLLGCSHLSLTQIIFFFISSMGWGEGAGESLREGANAVLRCCSSVLSRGHQRVILFPLEGT